MHLPAPNFYRSKVFCTLLTLTASMGTMQATNLLTATSPITLTCNTTTGPGSPANVVVKTITPLTTTNTLTVTAGSATGGLVVTPPTSNILNAANTTSAGTGITFTVNLSPGCVGATSGTSTSTFQFSTGSGADVVVTANVTVTATASPLVASPSPIALTCSKSGSVYTPGSAKSVSITSTAAGGTAFTIPTSGGTAPPAWVTLSSSAGGTASSTAITFTATPAAGCGGFAVGSTTNGTIQLVNSPAPNKSIPVTLQVFGPSPLSATPSSGSLSYVKGSGTPGYVDLAISATNPTNPFFSVDTSSLPIWLNVDSTNGTAPKSIRLSSTTVADTLAPGTYNASVRLKVSGYGDALVPISLLVTNPAARLSVAEGTTRNLTWVVGRAIPAPFITLVSTDSPISYSISTAGTLAPIIGSGLQKGLAYSFGTQIPVTFNPLVFAAAQPGSVLTGIATVTWGNPSSSLVISFNITVQSAGATVTAISPASLPTAAPGQTFTVSVIGTGFVPSTDPTQKTNVGIVVGGNIIADTNISTNVVNASNMTLTITVPVVADIYLPFSTSGSGGSVALGVCNPTGGSCTTPTGTATLSIGSNPIIQGVTSASSYQQVTAPTLQTMAPYDLVSLFGTNFCTSSGTGCSSSQILYSTVDATTLRYGTTVSPDNPGVTQRLLSVTFLTHGTTTVLGTAPILFATNNQINLIVPAALSASINSSVDMVVNFGYGTGATMRSSAPYPVSIIATNPGVFTVGADGQGDGAILGSNYNLISSTNPAGMRSTATDSDIIQIYMTGLGAPTGTADNASAGSGGSAAYPTDCITVASFLTSLSGQSGVTVSNADGAIIQSSLLNSNRFVPCLITAPTVTVGGVAATVSYAGWVGDSVAGLYQVNAKLPGRAGGTFQPATGSTFTNLLSPAYLPVVVTLAGRSSQSNVNLWVAPQLKVTGPSGAGLTGTVGTAWASSNNRAVATEGTSPYAYAVTSGLLPSGLLLDSNTGAISGTPAANTSGSYVVTVTATDSSNVPVSGTVTFTTTVAGGLYLTAPGAPFTPGATGTAYPAIVTISAAGGTYPYTFATTTNAGITIDPNTGVVSVASTVATGTYHVVVTATDSTTGTPLTGTITFDVTIS